MLTHQLQDNNNAEEEVCFIAHAFSSNHRKFAAIASNKKVLVWSTNELSSTPVERIVQKRPTCISFCHTNTNMLVVGDKTGDVFKIDLSKEEVSQEPLLGHLSMVLDVQISHNDRYIITADRDEKIRVSSFPLSYMISAWCLGHTQLVSSLCLCSQAAGTARLLSSAGDSMIRLWDYTTGTELAQCNVYTACKDQQIAVNNELDEEGCVVSQVVESGGYVCASVEQCNSLLFFRLGANNQLSELGGVNLGCQSQRIAFAADGSALVAATGAGLKTIEWNVNAGAFELSSSFSGGVQAFLRVAERQIGECAELLQTEDTGRNYYTELLKPGKRNRSIEIITPEATINFKPPVKLLKREGKLQEEGANGMEE